MVLVYSLSLKNAKLAKNIDFPLIYEIFFWDTFYISVL